MKLRELLFLRDKFLTKNTKFLDSNFLKRINKKESNYFWGAPQNPQNLASGFAGPPH